MKYTTKQFNQESGSKNKNRAKMSIRGKVLVRSLLVVGALACSTYAKAVTVDLGLGQQQPQVYYQASDPRYSRDYNQNYDSRYYNRDGTVYYNGHNDQSWHNGKHYHHKHHHWNYSQ